MKQFKHRTYAGWLDLYLRLDAGDANEMLALEGMLETAESFMQASQVYLQLVCVHGIEESELGQKALNLTLSMATNALQVRSVLEQMASSHPHCEAIMNRMAELASSSSDWVYLAQKAGPNTEMAELASKKLAM